LITLTVNVDHVATIRQARGGKLPDPVHAALQVELAGAHGITVHLREDRRHVQDRDVELLRRQVSVPLNLEMACTEEMIEIAGRLRPDLVTLVPERREELTTEGGLDVAGQHKRIQGAVERLGEAGIPVSLFVAAEAPHLTAAKTTGAAAVEIHTGEYANARGREQTTTLERLAAAAQAAAALGLEVHAGHGLDYQNVGAVAQLPEIRELAIGHSIVARAVLVGMERAVREMLELIREAERAR
jgi:pyridoxine 5-phosphate synthase